MASVTTKKQDVTYVIELSEREANALCELLLVASYDGEGDALDEIYCALQEAGAESDKCSNKIENGLVTVTRSP